MRPRPRDRGQQLVVVNIDAGEIVDRYAEIDHYTEKVVKPARPMGKNEVWIGATAAWLGAAHHRGYTTPTLPGWRTRYSFDESAVLDRGDEGEAGEVEGGEGASMGPRRAPRPLRRVGTA
jgi:hypothetical protein